MLNKYAGVALTIVYCAYAVLTHVLSQQSQSEDSISDWNRGNRFIFVHGQYISTMQ